MMKMTMRLQKKQLGNTLIKKTVSSTFERGPYLAAGFTQVDVMLVGGGGGRAGNAGEVSGDSNFVIGAGGGGGGFKRQTLNLVDLARSEAVLIGGAGGIGSDAGPGGGNAGTGGQGGTTTLATISAPGGMGGVGGRVLAGGGIVSYGVGGAGSSPDSASGAPGKTTQNGDFGVATSASGVVVGSGGGGGAGRVREESTVWARTSGGSGSAGLSNIYRHLSPDLTNNTQSGRSGGGANIAPITGGAAEYYGSVGAGSTSQGVAVIKVV